jgi:hypothetical protein
MAPVHQVLRKVRLSEMWFSQKLTGTSDGRITKIEHNPDSKSAAVHFEKASAAKTAVMVRNARIIYFYLNLPLMYSSMVELWMAPSSA